MSESQEDKLTTVTEFRQSATKADGTTFYRADVRIEHPNMEKEGLMGLEQAMLGAVNSFSDRALEMSRGKAEGKSAKEL